MTAARAVTGGLLVTADEVVRRDLRIRDGRWVGPSADGDAEPGDRGQIVDATGRIVLPGLVNAHDHLRSLQPATTRSETMSVPDMVAAAAAVGVHATAEDYRVLTTLAAARLVRSGVTSVIDHAYPIGRPDLLAAVVDGHAAAGIRGSVAVGVETAGNPALRHPPEAALRLLLEVADRLIPAERLFLAPVSLRQADVEAYAACAALTVGTGIRLYTHLAESASEVAQCRAANGVSPVQLMARIGFLRPGTVLVHGVHLDDADIATLADTETQVVYCPTNHLRFAKGFAPVVALRDAGVTVGLGVDGMGDLFGEMRQAMYAQGAASGQPGVLSTSQALAMATVSGARILGAPPVTGGFAPGDSADAVVVDASGLHLQPLADPRYAAAHKAIGADVTDVVVGGRPVLRAGRSCLVDAAELSLRARDILHRLAVRAGRPVPEFWRDTVAEPRDLTGPR